MLLWIFNSMNDALQFLSWKEVNIGDRIIILGMDQTTHEYQEWGWRNINGIYLKGEPGKNWENGRPWKSAEEVNVRELTNSIYEKLRSDGAFVRSLKWDKGDSIRWDRGEPGLPWETPDSNKIIDVIYEKLRSDKEFIKSLKGNEWYTPEKWVDYFDGKDWEPGKTPIPWEDFPIPLDGLDWTRRVLIENTNDIKLEKGERGIDFQKNIYIERNGSILKI